MKLSTFRPRPLAVVRLLSLPVVLSCAVLGASYLLSGCASSPRGVKVVSSSASMTNLGDINWDEYKIPVFSIVSGPRTTVWINKDYLALSDVRAGGVVTNDISALALYTDRGSRSTFVDLHFQPVTTNTPSNYQLPTNTLPSCCSTLAVSNSTTTTTTTNSTTTI